jgi:hypothetical protein
MSGTEVGAALAGAIEPDAQLKSDCHKSFGDVATSFAKHDIMTHSALEFVPGMVHINRTEGFKYVWLGITRPLSTQTSSLT